MQTLRNKGEIPNVDFCAEIFCQCIKTRRENEETFGGTFVGFLGYIRWKKPATIGKGK